MQLVNTMKRNIFVLDWIRFSLLIRLVFYRSDEVVEDVVIISIILISSIKVVIGEKKQDEEFWQDTLENLVRIIFICEVRIGIFSKLLVISII